LNTTIVSEILIPKISLEEQIRIAEVLTTLDTELEGLRGQLQRVKTQKKGLMQQLLTGKTRVKV
jgi:type I restriction enzyme, S subunit